MPIKYVQTLGAVAGIPQTVNAVIITCQKPDGLKIVGVKRPGVTLSVKPTLRPNFGGD